MKNKYTLDDLLSQNWQYHTEYDYDTDSHCQEYGCDKEGICRCSTIENFTIKEINANGIAESFCELADDEFTKYCIHRAVINCRIWDTSLWEYSICGGYYGQEIEYVKMTSDLANHLRKFISEILKCRNNQKNLFSVLNAEYGYILPELNKIKDFKIENVNIQDIHVGNLDHYKKLDKKIVDQYSSYNLPVGVCVKKSGEYRLIDGYHRLAAKNKSSNHNKMVKIIVGSCQKKANDI